MTVRTGDVILLGGFLDSNKSTGSSGVPLLKDIPLLGNLFKSKDTNRQRTELVLIVTPEVTTPLNPNDPKPEIYFPKDFLVRLEPGDVAQGGKNKSASKKN